jgi:hypothetical protein
MHLLLGILLAIAIVLILIRDACDFMKEDKRSFSPPAPTELPRVVAPPPPPGGK